MIFDGKKLELGMTVLVDGQIIGKITGFMCGPYCSPNELCRIEIDKIEIRDPCLESHYAKRHFEFIEGVE